MADADWRKPSASCLGVFLAGDRLDEHDERSQPLRDDNFLLLLNAGPEIDFVLPAFAGPWEIVVDTSDNSLAGMTKIYQTHDRYRLPERSLNLFRQRHAASAQRDHTAAA